MAADSRAQQALGPAVGLFGGRFDPVHRAHQAMATACADQLNLDEIRWIVSGAPPHKPAIETARHRLEMVRLAIAEMCDSRMKADDWEVRAALAQEVTYTADTLQHFRQTREQTRFIWILGQDQFDQLTTWSRWAWLVNHMEFAVFGRPSNCSSDSASNKVSADLGVGAIIHTMPTLDDPISSTLIRDRLARGQSIKGLTPATVIDYIATHHLYRP